MLLDALLADSQATGMPAGLEVSGLSPDSRQIEPGYLFFALSGSRAQGADYAGDAIARGAVAVVAEPDAALGQLTDVPVINVADGRRALALAASQFHARQPGKIAAVTGTSGKTSVVTFLRQIWSLNRLEAASIGTVGVVAPGMADYGGLTTPDPVALHRTLDELAGGGVTHAAMEASSHGIEQRRLDGVRLSAAAFLNLSRDHLDYHHDMETYLAAKLRLFDTLLPQDGVVVVDAGEPTAQPAADIARSCGQTLMTVGRGGTALRLERVETERLRQILTIDYGSGRQEVSLNMAGVFQVSNALVAAGLAIATGIDAADAVSALPQLVGAEGRLQPVAESGPGSSVFVDYAHKPEALRITLSALRPFVTGKLIVVIGAGGDRDPGKRPLMGQAASDKADVVIVTDDNPRSEDPRLIRRAVLEGAPDAIEIGDRREAIGEAVRRMRPGDAVVIAGKGHETGQTVGDTVLPFSDFDAARDALGRQD
ncbi:MAG: UDP-N-acetylmuramoyl-L-alanyl-D-glutamate--2,6-diaminopimelate ligase [Pseudomonadota bacterium]